PSADERRAGWPRADVRLERAYRLLLLAYPGRYRRRHGAEIVTTLLEMAEPGRRRPARADAWHLLASGLRQRFRLPAGRPLAWAAAVLITLITGAFGAAAGSWAGAQTFAGLPEQAALAERVTGTAGGRTWVHDTSSWSHTARFTDTEVAHTWQIEPARQRMRADGWQVSPVTPVDGSAHTVDPATGAMIDLPMRNNEFRATRDGVQLSVRAFLADSRVAPAGTVDTSTWAGATPVFLPLTVAGTVVGLVAGWLLAAAGAYRVRRSRRPRLAATTCALAVIAAALPAVALYGNLMRALRYAGDFGPVFTVHSAFTPGDYYPFGPPWQVLALSIAGVLLAAATVVIARPGQPAAVPQQSPAAG
ncbi:hypothetical protein DMB66_06900, partial [Actinoplanes sp. ATCC 53533]|uniref:hypothetical protein n=1 Tax=Actinoplanes sp. ATCC 53533 TaxID=1288362 RepID=UPI001000DD40